LPKSERSLASPERYDREQFVMTEQAANAACGQPVGCRNGCETLKNLSEKNVA